MALFPHVIDSLTLLSHGLASIVAHMSTHTEAPQWELHYVSLQCQGGAVL